MNTIPSELDKYNASRKVCPKDGCTAGGVPQDIETIFYRRDNMPPEDNPADDHQPTEQEWAQYVKERSETSLLTIPDTVLGHKFKIAGNQVLDLATLVNELCENPIALEEEASIMLHVFDLGMCAEVFYPGAGHMKKKVYHLAVAENDTMVTAMYCYTCISCEQEVQVEECVSPHETCPECLEKQQEEANEELRAQHRQTTGVGND